MFTQVEAGGKTFTMAEVAEHVTEQSAWFVHEGSVYDATPFLEDHPGGEKGQKIRILLSYFT